jgi:hypothetical protein
MEAQDIVLQNVPLDKQEQVAAYAKISFVVVTVQQMVSNQQQLQQQEEIKRVDQITVLQGNHV